MEGLLKGLEQRQSRLKFLQDESLCREVKHYAGYVFCSIRTIRSLKQHPGRLVRAHS